MNKLVVIGHVDAGKSTLIGHLLCKLKIYEEHVILQIQEKAIRDKKESQIYSRMTDIFEEEMEKGKTHEFNEIKFTYEGVDYNIIDTPGHQSFVRSMISGISRDVKSALVVISMKDNEFEASFGSGMLREHLSLAKAVGIENLIVVANKMGLIKWDKDVAAKQLILIKTYLIKELRWNPDKLKIIPVDSYSGVNLLDSGGAPDWIKKPLFSAIRELPLIVKTETKKLIKITKMKIDGTIIQLPAKELFTKMYLCIAHYDGNETEVSVEQIEGKTFIKQTQNAIITFNLPEEITISVDCRIILRKNDMTIGFGKLLNE